jgi:hypothetical protein
LDNSRSARGRLDIDQLRIWRRRSLEDEPWRFRAEIDDEQLVRPERNVASSLIVESSARAVSRTRTAILYCATGNTNRLIDP